MQNRIGLLEPEVDISKIKPLNAEVLVKVKKAAKKTSGGIILDIGNSLEYTDNARRICEIVAMGEFAFSEHKTKPQLNDTALISRYIGELVQEDEDYLWKLVKDYEFLALYK